MPKIGSFTRQDDQTVSICPTCGYYHLVHCGGPLTITITIPEHVARSIVMEFPITTGSEDYDAGTVWTAFDLANIVVEALRAESKEKKR